MSMKRAGVIAASGVAVAAGVEIATYPRWRKWCLTWGATDADLGTIFRHEINNPLTGILGNAELVLAHRDHLSAVDTQRLQTVVDLAVRLRETVRRLSNAWEHQHPSAKSA